MNNFSEIERFWINYNHLVQPFMDSTLNDLSDGLTLVKTPKMESPADNYIAVRSQKGLDYMLSENFNYSPVHSITFLPFKTENEEENLKQVTKKFFGSRPVKKFHEFWIKGTENTPKVDINQLENELKPIKEEQYTFIISPFNNNEMLKNYENSFVEGFKAAEFLPPDSNYYVKKYLAESSNPQISTNIAIGIKDKNTGEIAGCSFLLTGNSLQGNEKLAYFHGDTIIPAHTGNKLQRYLIAYRRHIAESMNIKPQNMFSIVEKNSPSHKNYINNAFQPIHEKGMWGVYEEPVILIKQG